MAAKGSQPHYTVVIQWSDEDACYVASLPEWHPLSYCGAHGATYEEAAKNAREVLEVLIETHDPARQGPLPPPKKFHYPGADVVDLPEERPATRPSRAAG
jgi:predicted RNase H-like HicB family nuclease